MEAQDPVRNNDQNIKHTRKKVKWLGGGVNGMWQWIGKQ